MKLLEIYGKLSSDLHYIERKLEASIRSDDSELNDAALHLMKAGGKRIRPVFVLLSGRFGKYDIERLSHIAVPLELIHMGTLVHDDVIDDAATRRGQPTVRAKWDDQIAMYTGDYMLAKALTIAAKLEQAEIHQVLSRAMVQMAIGEMEQVRMFYRMDQSIRDYLLRIRRKTALLIAISCQLGAMAAGAPHQVAQRLYSFGYNVGMAFQIRDDLLDITGTEKQLGKPPGSDLRQGNLTLPVLYALEDPQVREVIVKAIEHKGEDPILLNRALAGIRKSVGMKQAEHMAMRYIDKAIAALAPLPEFAAKKDLTAIAKFLADRTY